MSTTTSEMPDRPGYSRLWVTHPHLKENSPAHVWLTGTRGIHPVVLEAATAQEELREGPNATLWAAHRSPEGTLTGWDAEGPDFQGFSAGGARSLFTLDAANGQATRIAVAATPIEAMSLATIERMQPDTIYAAVSGAVGPETTTALRTFARRVNPEQIDFVVGTPATNAGNALAEQIADTVRPMGIVPKRLFPSQGRKDFNAMITQDNSGPTRAPQNDSEGGTIPQNATISTIERGQPRPIDETTKISTDIGQSDAGFHYKTIVTLNNRDFPPSDWSKAFQSENAAKEAAMFGAGRAVERALNGEATTSATRTSEASNQPAKSPYLMAVDAMKQNTTGLDDNSPNVKLKQRIEDLSQRGTKPGELEKSAFRQEVAWALVDLERATGKPIAIPKTLRDELLTQAVSIAGLADQSVTRLMKHTVNLEKQETVDAIRDLAVRIATLDEPQIRGRDAALVRNLENKVLDDTLSRETKLKALADDQVAASNQLQNNSNNQRSQQAAKPTANGTQQATVQATNANVRINAAPAPRPAPSPRQGPGWIDGAANLIKGVFGSPDNGLGIDGRPAPTQPAPYANTNFDHQGEVNAIERDMRVSDVATAAAAATAALTSLKQIMGGISQKIDAAAENDPGGYAAVMSGMKPDGQYAGLRAEFDGQMAQSQEFAGKFQEAVGAVKTYAVNRMDTETWFRNNNQPVSELDELLKPVEKGLFSFLEKTPGEKDGLSMIGDLAEKFGEFFAGIYERARSAMGFDKAPGNDQGPTAGPQNENRPGPRPG